MGRAGSLAAGAPGKRGWGGESHARPAAGWSGSRLPPGPAGGGTGAPWPARSPKAQAAPRSGRDAPAEGAPLPLQAKRGLGVLTCPLKETARGSDGTAGTRQSSAKSGAPHPRNRTPTPAPKRQGLGADPTDTQGVGGAGRSPKRKPGPAQPGRSKVCHRLTSAQGPCGHLRYTGQFRVVRVPPRAPGSGQQQGDTCQSSNLPTARSPARSPAGAALHSAGCTLWAPEGLLTAWPRPTPPPTLRWRLESQDSGRRLCRAPRPGHGQGN